MVIISGTKEIQIKLSLKSFKFKSEIQFYQYNIYISSFVAYYIYSGYMPFAVHHWSVKIILRGREMSGNSILSQESHRLQPVSVFS